MFRTNLVQSVAVSVLLLTLEVPSYTDGLTRNVNNKDCSSEYIETYDENVQSAFKVLDAVQAERIFINRNQQVSNSKELFLYNCRILRIV